MELYKNMRVLIWKIIACFFFAAIFLIPLQTAHAQSVPSPLLFYQANPRTYNWTVNGRTYTNNKNPYGMEVYTCNKPGAAEILQRGNEKRDTCIPSATTSNGMKLWSKTLILYQSIGNPCRHYQLGYDGPTSSSDTRRLNGTANTNAQTAICATRDADPNPHQATYPFINVSKSFVYDTSYCANGNKVVVSSRQDPSNTICTNLNMVDMLNNPAKYSQNQHNCLLFADDRADVTACKNGVCKTHSFTSDVPNAPNEVPLPSLLYENVCSIFSQGNGTYNVTMKIFDLYPTQYGSSSLWLTHLTYGIPHSISGKVFNDVNKNNKQDAGEATYTGPISITSSAGTVTTTGGSYSITGIPSGTVTVSFPTLPSGYQMVYPLNGPPPSFSATVGPGCSVDGATGATCTTGDITNLNFAITNSFPWMQAACGDVRFDAGVVNPQPAGKSMLLSNASCSGPGVVFTGDLSADFGKGNASSLNQVVGGSSYPEVFAVSSTDDLFSSYANLVAKAKSAGITPMNLSSVCSLSNCSLPNNLPHGIYQANGNVNLNATSFVGGRDYVFLVNGNLTLRGDVSVPNNSNATVLFAASGNMIVPASVGETPSSSVPSLSGIFSTDKSFVVQSTNTCADQRLNIEGNVIVNAARNGGSLQNDRDLCGNNPLYPTLQITQRLDFVLNLPEFIRSQQVTSQEVAP